ncbi:M15 family metallopeptidase [Nocardioides marmorisolisilvae]|uniref:M15 family peptidase n=1 Tax=Nocardioides marmorisolisilvae TaxID=1542737 RepID=A0A3N0DI00_9ACTN|nr:M15 family metallopeptidase [Nocardioides marmorisolisilvae]RNL75317.1 M15 family peptidase [Nocardioides marmorisolisilvae]
MRSWGAGVLALCAALALAGCGGTSPKDPKPAAHTSTGASTPPASLADVAMPRPGKLKPPILSADILVQSQDPLPPSLVAQAKGIKSVVAVDQFSLASFYSEEDEVTYAAVDPSAFRYFAAPATAQTAEVWNRIADGEIAITPELKAELPITHESVTMGNDDDAETVHIGAFAPLVLRSKISAIVNERWADKLHMVKNNALIVSTGEKSPLTAQKNLRKAVGNRGSVTLLALHFDINAPQTAILTGGSVARAVGSFTYTANADGTVNPDKSWVRAFIRTETVPIIGRVTCNKAMIPQLRAALNEVVARGLASKIHKNEYGGCYVPRYIAKDPAQGLSFHTFGTAIDLNVPGNQRGTVGTMDRTVVKIFEKWGFNWGGNWHYTDPMHFELARIVAVR